MIGPSKPNVLYFAAEGGLPPRYVLPTMQRMGLEVTPAIVRPPDEAERQAARKLFEKCGTIIEAGSLETLTTEVKKAVKRRPVDGVVAFSELIVDQATEVACEFGLPSTSIASRRRTSNKLLQRMAMRDHGLPCPRFARVAEAGDLIGAYEKVGVPGVLKPAFNAASYLTFLINSFEELAEQFRFASAQLRVAPLRCGEPFFIYEELLRGVNWHGDARYGDYVSVESIVHDGKVQHICVSDKPPLVYPFREGGFILPSALPADRQRELFAVAEAAIAALGFTHGATHVEIKLTPEGPRILEVNGRIGGPVPYLYNLATGKDLAEDIVRNGLGLPPRPTAPFGGVGAFLQIQGPARLVRVAKLGGIDRIRVHPAVRGFDVVKPAGSVVDWRRGTSENIVVIALSAPDHETLWRHIADLQEVLEISYSNLDETRGAKTAYSWES